jgi:hypothetical protein
VPLPLTGVDFSNLPKGVTPAELESIFASPSVARDVERAEGFKAVADRETKEIEERIAAARAQRARSTK